MDLHRRSLLRRAPLLATAPAWLLAAPPARAQRPERADPDRPDDSVNWQRLRERLYGTRAIVPANGAELELDAPARADDAAVVPLAIRSDLPVDGPGRVTRIWLLIDQNPTVLAGTFTFSPASGRAGLQTRVRIDEYTHVRAVAETADGTLRMARRFVKASGGCSAPPGKDAAAAMATLGRMRLRADDGARVGSPTMVQLMISHPNHSGLAMDQLTRQFTPAHFVRTIAVTDRGAPVFGADVDFSLSENPNLRFWWVPQAGSQLQAVVTDSQDRSWTASLPAADVRG